VTPYELTATINTMATLQTAVQLIEDGDWQSAHTLVQGDSSRLACWAHGIVHLMEGDQANADYWYQRAERELIEDIQVASEIAALKAEVAGG